MNSATLEELLSLNGRSAIEAANRLAPTEAKYPACFDRLRKHYPAELVRAALDTVLLRDKARRKFTRADEMVFTRESLEMASGEIVSRYRAERFSAFDRVADLGCGIGGDAIGLASAGRSVVAVDTDAVRLRMAEENLRVHGLGARFLCDNALTVELADVDAAFADPGRRAGGKRRLALEEYEPPVSHLIARFPHGFPLGVKVAPGLDPSERQNLEADAEFISVEGELKECVLWFGALRRGTIQATLLPGPHILTGERSCDTPLSPVQSYLYDPDPAITRAGLVGTLASRLGAAQLDPLIAFLTSDHPRPTPFATLYRVEDAMPFHAKRLGEWLRSRRVGRVTMVKRGSPVDTNELMKRWKLRGDEHRTVILTRLGSNPLAILAEPMSG